MQFDWDTFTDDEKWLKKSAQIEKEVDCDICAAYEYQQAITKAAFQSIPPQSDFHDHLT